MKTRKILMPLLSVLLLTNCSQEGEYDDDSYSNAYYGSVGYNENYSGDTYNQFQENQFVSTSQEPVSTFSIDADGASYSNVRRFILQENRLPDAGALRTEEMINYFDLDYPFNETNHPISLNGEVSDCPWNDTNKVVRIGIKGRPFADGERPASNIVFLIDVSGSMSSNDKLGLLKTGFNYFVDQINNEDRIAIVTYAGSAGVALPSTSGDQKQTIKNAINQLGAGGSTAGAQGIITAYEIAQQHFIEGGNNRVIVGSDGDFNVGPSSQEELIDLIEAKRESGIYLTILGVGRGNLRDGNMEQMANHGNGTYEYLDNVDQAKKVFDYEFNKFYTVAKDVKVQVEFNPQVVGAYRLIGYENRILNQEDFEDDSEDAGEIGAGQSITALYEIVPRVYSGNHLAFSIDFRYKLLNEDSSTPMSLQVYDQGNNFEQASDFMKFTSSVAAFSMLVNNSQFKGSATYDGVINWLNSQNLPDPNGHLAEFKTIVQKAKQL